METKIKKKKEKKEKRKKRSEANYFTFAYTTNDLRSST